MHTAIVAALASWAVVARAQSSIASASCSPTLTAANHAAPSVAEGYVARLVADGLTKPRGIKFDSQDALLVVESGSGITALTFTDGGDDCVSVRNRSTVVDDATLNHGIEISRNGTTLYASSPEAVYSWDYSSQTRTNTSAPTTILANMTTTDHTTRTLLLPEHAPGLLVVTRGSTANIDPDASDLASGHSQVKAFNLANQTGPYDFDADGLLLGWGLRNDVGVAEEPLTGGIYTVENSADELWRQDTDIHADNPAEELNFLGYLNGTSSPTQGRNFGYPACFAAWNATALPAFTGHVGDQFAVNTTTTNDTACAADYQAPRLVFQAHMAPLDIKFNAAGTAAWVTFHGSWDRAQPVGYKVSLVEFADGEPRAERDSLTAARDVVANADNGKCPDGCFRPVGLAWDSRGR